MRVTPVVLAMLLILGSNSEICAQSPRPQPELAVEHLVEIKPGSMPKSSHMAPQTVVLNISDSTIGYILQALGKQVDRPVIFDGKDPRFSKRKSVRISDSSVMRAFESVLQGTGLRVAVASDGRTVVVQSRPERSPGSSGSQGDQERSSVSGVVVDSSTGKGIAGVVVSVMGTASRVITDDSGRFTITGVEVGSRSLSFRLLGYVSTTRGVVVEVNKVAAVEVRLVQAVSSLNEVVTTATGQQRRVEVPGDIVKIDAEEIRERAPVRSVTDMLEAAQVPGVLVTRASGDPGAPTRIRMRGIGSISKSNDPLIIVDGVWIDNKSDNQGARGIDAVDPESIETIEIVRGPSAATMYGMDASNGVIVITTKKGRPGTTRWDLGYSYDWGQIAGKKPSLYFGVGRPNPELDTLIAIHCPALTRSNTVSVMTGSCFQDSIAIYDPNHPLLKNEAIETNHRMNFAVSGGSDKLLYSLMFSSQDQIGARRQTPIDFIRLRKLGVTDLYDFSSFERPVILDRRSITTNFTVRPQESLNVNVSVAVSQQKTRNNGLDSDGLRGLPDIDAARSLSLDTIQFLQFPDASHKIIPDNQKTHSSGVRLNSTVEWLAAGGIRVAGGGGIDYGLADNSAKSNDIVCLNDFACENSVRSDNVNRIERNTYTARLSASTVLRLGRWERFIHLQPSLGGDFRRTENSSLATSGLYNRFNNASAGWYLNSNIRVLQRLYFDLGIRQDVGGAITSTSRTGGLPFMGLPKLGSSWLVSDEPFWPQNNLVNLFRLRGAIGYAAVQPEIGEILGVYYRNSVYTDSSRFVDGITLNTFPNHTLVPEKSGEIELGFDSEMFNEKVYMIVTYAHKENRNAIVNRRVAPSAGGGGKSRRQNIARVVNKNLELSTTARLIESNRVQLQANYNLTLSENKVAELGNRVTPFNDPGIGRIAEGYPVAGQWSRVVLAYHDANGDGLISPDEVVVSDSAVYRGWSQPRHRSSFGFSLSLLNSAVTFDSRFSYQGNYAQNYTYENFRAREDIGTSLLGQAIFQAGRLSGSLGSDVGNNMSGTQAVSDLRWNSASMSFYLPQDFTRRLKSRSIQVRFQASNLALWTNYSGRDPGVNSSLLNLNSSDLLYDNGRAMPRPRLFAIELRWGI